MPRVLLVVTSAHPLFYSSGKHTGVFWSEAVEPYDVLTAAGWTVDVVSETGHAAVDEHSVGEEMLAYSKSADTWNDKSHPMHAILASGLKSGKDVKAADYDAIFFSAGHGALYDYPTAHNVARIAVELYEAGKYVAAVCHGPVIFAATLNSKGESIAKGKRITGFTRKGEQMMGVDNRMAADGVRDCEAIAQQIGAIWDEPADAWADYTTADGLILTGVNPAAGKSLARNLLKAVQG
jgi:putative intracellular protease/amidase